MDGLAAAFNTIMVLAIIGLLAIAGGFVFGLYWILKLIFGG